MPHNNEFCGPVGPESEVGSNGGCNGASPNAFCSPEYQVPMPPSNSGGCAPSANEVCGPGYATPASSYGAGSPYGMAGGEVCGSGYGGNSYGGSGYTEAGYGGPGCDGPSYGGPGPSSSGYGYGANGEAMGSGYPVPVPVPYPIPEPMPVPVPEPVCIPVPESFGNSGGGNSGGGNPGGNWNNSGGNCNDGNGSARCHSPKEGHGNNLINQTINMLTGPDGAAVQKQLFNTATDNISTAARDAQKIPDGTVNLEPLASKLEARFSQIEKSPFAPLVNDLKSASKSGSDNYTLNLKQPETIGPVKLSNRVTFQEHDVNGKLVLDHIQGISGSWHGVHGNVTSLTLEKNAAGKPQIMAQVNGMGMAAELAISINSAQLARNARGQLGLDVHCTKVTGTNPATSFICDVVNGFHKL